MQTHKGGLTTLLPIHYSEKDDNKSFFGEMLYINMVTHQHLMKIDFYTFLTFSGQL